MILTFESQVGPRSPPQFVIDERQHSVARRDVTSPPPSRTTRAPSIARSRSAATRCVRAFVFSYMNIPVVHVQGGFLVSIAREVCYQADAGPDDVLYFATDMGWIMGPWTVVGGGAMGTTLVFAEGAPDWPDS